MEPTLLYACQLSGLQYKDLRLPRELTLWIDPGEVSCRIGEMRPQHFTVARVSKDGLQYLENRTRDIDIDDAERRHVESVRRTRSDLFSTTTTSTTAVTDARAKAAARDLAERRALVASSSSSSSSSSTTAIVPALADGFSMDSTMIGDDSLSTPFYSDGGSGGFDNLDRFYGPPTSPPATKQMPNILPHLSNGFLPTWNGADQNGFFADAHHGYPMKTSISVNNGSSATTNNNMRGRANSYRNGTGSGGGLRQHNSLSSSSPISNSNSNLSTSSNSTPPPNSQNVLCSRYSPPSTSAAGHYSQNNNEQHNNKRQPKPSGSLMSHSVSYNNNVTPASVNAPVSAAGNPFVVQQHPQQQPHYNYQRPQQHQSNGPYNNPSAAVAALAFFPPSMASGPGIPPHPNFMLSPAHGPNHHHPQHHHNIMPNHNNHQHLHHNHPYGVASHHSLIAQRSTALLSSE